MDDSQILAIFRVIEKSLEGPLREKWSYFEPSEFQGRFDAFNALIKELKERNKTLEGVIPGEIQPEYRDNLILAHTAASLYRRIQFTLDLFKEMHDPGAHIDATEQGVFVGGRPFDAFMATQKIISQASRKIALIDGYLDSGVIELLCSAAPSVELDVLTTNLDSLTKLAAEKFQKQYGNVSVRASKAFHDRFLIIDEKEIYHFGHSIKDLGASRVSMFSKIEQQEVINEILSIFNAEWAVASVLV